MRGLAGIVVASWLVAPAAGLAAPLRERFGAATVDFSAGTVSVEGAAAGDLHAPGAAVARVRAERLARAVAARRLAEALTRVPAARLGCPAGAPEAAQIEAAAARAPATIEWSSDGSVALTLAIPLGELLPGAGPEAAASDGSRAGRVVEDPGASPTWFGAAAGRCTTAPRYFHTVADAREALGDRARPAPGAAGSKAGAPGALPAIVGVVIGAPRPAAAPKRGAR